MAMPSVTVGKSEHLGHYACLFERSDHPIHEWLNARIAGIHGGMAARHPHDRFVEIPILEADGAQHRPVGRARHALRDDVGASVEILWHSGSPFESFPRKIR
jgi:hypothetical protein